ncbi:hypothetical protein QMK33_10370 [Hymenobacter sp. H14-R3]|uniref:hypothetical protein n=1 Tax=Hymenobacter sp. H14-R3 TaxID=3046308 RepID=UPI0024BBB981|nr:hypothetical protein [Hymenobacter sp. H14-R3]MDJ0365560.1 hypothetical protein [Hymenobacter sp. H14-R3]
MAQPPARAEAGRRQAAAADSARRSHSAIGMPKGTGVNAVASGTRAGTPAASMPR